MKTLALLLSASLTVVTPLHAQEKKESTYQITDHPFKAHDTVEMFGRLALPTAKKPRAVVIYVQTAEGATVDQKRPLGRGKTFNYHDLYREKLTAMGVGFFSYEGRGIRMGDELPRFEKIDWDVYNTSTLDNKVKDILSAIAVVKKQKGLGKTPVFLMGASEGTLLAAEAAAKQPDSVAGLILYGVLVTNLRDTFRYIMSDGEFVRYRPLDGNKDGVVTKAEWEKVVKGVEFAKGDLNQDGKFTVDDIKVQTKKYLDAIDNDDYAVLQEWAETSAAVAVPKNWFKDHFAHADNWTFLSKLNIPVGCFHGELDRMTPVSAVRDLQAKAKKEGLSKMEFHYFEDGDHSLKLVQYFAKGDLPKGHEAIFQYINRLAPK